MSVRAVVKPSFTNITLSPDTVATFDREGRFISYVENGNMYRRTLASAVQVRWREDQALPGQRRPRRRRHLDLAETRALFAQVREAVAAVRPAADDELRSRLEEEILPWTPDALLAEAQRFAQVYKPIPILPPDQYLSIVLQATEGCTWNRCTFCTFYQGRPFRAKDDADFAAHIEGVQQFFGRGALLRKSVFLADGNALALAQRRLIPIMEMTRAAFPDLAIYSFIDLYSGERKSVDEWRQLAQLGLHRVYIGMETGLDDLLAFLNKPGSRDELIVFVHDLKAAGLAVGLIVMVGAGGVHYKTRHADATLEALRRMPLAEDDLVYLSPFVEQPGSAYIDQRTAEGLTPMSEDEIEAELQRLAAAIRDMGVKAARYDIREFLY